MHGDETVPVERGGKAAKVPATLRELEATWPHYGVVLIGGDRVRIRAMARCHGDVFFRRVDTSRPSGLAKELERLPGFTPVVEVGR
jgi:hypothetical protein